MSGDRVYLRLLAESDINDRYVAFFQDEELIRYYSGSKRVFTRESLLQDLRDGINSSNHFVFGIFLKENDLCIGNTKVGPIVKQHGIADLSTILGDRSYHGRGLAAEAIQLANRVAF